MNKENHKLVASIKAGQACGYSISTIGKYEIHCWTSDKTVLALYGSFPHFNSKCGYHITVEQITTEDLEAIKSGTFDKTAFDKKLIEKFKQMFPHLWIGYNG